MKKSIPLLILFLVAGFANKNPLNDSSVRQIRLHGYAGSVIDKCIDSRIKGQDIDHLVEPFKLKNETRCWQSEFWGKWMLSAVDAYKYSGGAELLKKMRYAVDGLVATQLENGYIGNYGVENQLTGWDIWGRKYSMLGLIRYYEISSDKRALEAASKVADHLIGQVGPGKTNIIETGFYRGMASSSVLEPIVYLYHHTSKKEYLAFAEYIVAQWETGEGPKLISKALAGVNVADRFPPPESWWSWENGQKAYEMMSCYDGLFELYKITKKPEYLEAVIKTVDNIIETEINIAGSGSAFECWYGTAERQTQPTYHTMETCVTTTWMKLCDKLLEHTRDPKYADQVEKSFYNALMASMKCDASEIAKYSPLEGSRIEGEQQCSMHINCCNANGPRGFVLMPSFAVKTIRDNVFINYYGAFNAELMLENGHKIHLRQSTGYPETGLIELSIHAEKEVELDINLRIPEWSIETKVSVNGAFIENIVPGAYLRISRTWGKNDKISINLDMRGRLHERQGHQAITMGPVVLARDSRFEDGFVDETAVIQNMQTVVNLTPVANKPPHVWMAFSVEGLTGTDLEGTGKIANPIRFCDFASAGNTWESSTRYRVWIRKTLHVMNRKYEGY